MARGIRNLGQRGGYTVEINSSIGNYGQSNAPLGRSTARGLLSQFPSPSIPEMVPGFAKRQETAIPPPIDRRDVVSPPVTMLPNFQGKVLTPFPAQGVVAQNWFEYWDLKDAGVPVLPPVGQKLAPERVAPPLVPNPTIPNIINDLIKPEAEDAPMDLGTVLTDLAGQYINAKFSPSIQTVEYSPFPASAITTQADFNLGGIPGIEVIPESGYTQGACWNPRAKCGQGAWVKRRRRRRRLASASDIKDLTSLLSVFGNGKALQTWIATH